MRKRKLCQASFNWKLECKGPLIICDGRYEKPKANDNKGAPNCMFMSHCTDQEIKRFANQSTTAPPRDLKFFVPGTSLRGPFRAVAERIIRTLLPHDAFPPFTACDPFEQSKDKTTTACTKNLEKVDEGESKYASACPACKIFGCGGLASRIFFTDADIEPGFHSVFRDMIGIDRFTGGVYKNPENQSGANMRFHVLENTMFQTTVTIDNFELWQLGLVAYVFREFEQELVPIGFGKSKGFGRIKGTVTDITLAYPNNCDRIEHLGSLATSPAEKLYYRFHDFDPPPFEYLELVSDSELSLYSRYKVSGDHIRDFWTTVASAFNAYVRTLESAMVEVAS